MPSLTPERIAELKRLRARCLAAHVAATGAIQRHGPESPEARRAISLRDAITSEQHVAFDAARDDLLDAAEENARLRAERQKIAEILGHVEHPPLPELVAWLVTDRAKLRAAVEPLKPWLRKCLERYRPDAADDIQPSFEVQIALGVLRALLAAMETEFTDGT